MPLSVDKTYLEIECLSRRVHAPEIIIVLYLHYILHELLPTECSQQLHKDRIKTS